MARGTVTFLFTDVEGSTRLLALLKDRYAELLEDHHRLIRAAFEPVGGQEAGTQGDSFFVTFSRAKDAVLAAVAAQRALASHRWPDGVDVRVRMGLHTGEPSVSRAGIVSMAVHRAARIAAAGHGGQVLLSSTTRDLVEDELPHGVSIQELGEHRLKDLDRPEQISQLVIDGLPSEFPPLNVASTTRIVGSSRRRAAALGLLVLAALAAGLAGVRELTRGRDGLTAAANTVAVIDPASNRLTRVISVGTSPTSIVAGGGAVWTLNAGEQTISRIDPDTLTRTRTIAAGSVASDVAFAAGTVWAVDAERDVIYPVDATGVGEPVQLGIRHRRRAFVPVRVALAADADRIWATGGDLTLVLFDARTSRVVDRWDGFPSVGADAAPGGPTIAVGQAGVWTADGRDEILRRDVEPEEVAQLGGFGGDDGIAAIAVGRGAVWATGAGLLWRIRPSPVRPDRTFPVGAGPRGIALGEGAVWTANSYDGTVTRLDVTDGETTTIDVGGTPNDIVFAHGRVWVSVS